MRRFAIMTVGCKTNQFESSSIARQLIEAGLTQVSPDQEADIYIINSCTVTARADADTRKLVRRCASRHSGASIVLTGCFAQVAPDEARSIPGVSFVAGNDHKKLLAEIIASGFHSTPEADASSLLPLAVHTERTRAVLRIQTGCDSFCSYCIVPHARGRSRSVPLAEILDAIRSLAGRHDEIILTGIHIGKYGHDLPEPLSLADLLQVIETAAPSCRIRLGSIEPLEFDDRLVEIVSSSTRILPHLHIPVQSGSEKILSLMNRPYHPVHVSSLFDRLKSRIRNLTIGIDMIVGFPGESDELFAETLSFLETLPFDYAHVFPFSPRKGTPAATMPHQVPPASIRERSSRVRALAVRKKEFWLNGWMGKTDTVLLLNRLPDGRMSGITPSYVPVVLESMPDEKHSILPCRFIRREGDRLVASPVDPATSHDR